VSVSHLPLSKLEMARAGAKIPRKRPPLETAAGVDTCQNKTDSQRNELSKSARERERERVVESICTLNLQKGRYERSPKT